MAPFPPSQLWYFSHNIRLWLEPLICYTLVQHFKIGHVAMYSSIFVWRLRTYSRIGHSLTASIASFSGRCLHSSSPMLRDFSPVILLAIPWWNAYNNFTIVSVITKILLLCSSTVCITSLYIIVLASRLPLSSPGPSTPCPAASFPSQGFGTGTLNHYYYTLWCRPSREMQPLNPGGPS